MDVNRKKSKPPSGLDLPDLYKQVMFSDIVKSSKELYAKGSLIEPFIMLHGLLESLLMTTWAMFLYTVQDPEKSESINGMLWNYRDSVELLYQAKLISKSEKNILDSFREGRNKIAHDLMHFKGNKPNKKDLDVHFADGLSSVELLGKIGLKISELSKKERVIFDS